MQEVDDIAIPWMLCENVSQGRNKGARASTSNEIFFALLCPYGNPENFIACASFYRKA